MTKGVDALLAALLLAALVILAVRITPDHEELSGTVRVVDGDTLELNGRKLRLSGMDAPELGQTCERGGQSYRCGEVARETLRNLARHDVKCQVSGRDRYGRGLAVCLGAGDDLGRALVRSGWAVSYGRYGGEEREAAARGTGLWAGRFERPSEWRKAHPH